MRIALAGFSQGYYAVEYTRYLSTLKGIEICAVCDLDQSEEYIDSCAFVHAPSFAQEVGAPLVHTVEKTIALAPDAVLVCAETADHTKLALRFMNAGAHVFVSKPLCFLSGQADALAVQAPQDRILLCGQPLRHETGVQELISRLPEIGRIYAVRIRLCHAAMIHQAWERDSARSGGPLGTYGVYLFDLAQALSGVHIHTLFASGMNAVTPQIEDFDTVRILASGGCVSFSLELFSAVNAPMPFLQAEIVGEKGMLETHYDNSAVVASFPSHQSKGSLRTSDMTRGEMDHFLQCIRGAEAPACGIAAMQYVTRCIEAVRESIGSGLPVTVKEVTP